MKSIFKKITVLVLLIASLSSPLTSYAATTAQTSVSSSSTATTTAESNEHKVFVFLKKHCKLNTAAACGVLANIKRESSFNPKASSGSCYGICQWTGSRKSALKSWCKKHGYSSSSLKGQCYYLKHELKCSYPKVWKYLHKVSNSKSGAYDAGYYFCYHFERPARKSSSSRTRGEIAQTYYKKYK